MPIQSQQVVHLTIFPIYSDVKTLMKIWKDTTSKSAALELVNSLWEQTGTPQNPVDWSNPDDWIESRLSEVSKQIAKQIGEASAKKTNPTLCLWFLPLHKPVRAFKSGYLRRLPCYGDR